MINNSFLRYCLVGGVGFIFDGGLLYALTALGADPFSSRAISIILALLVTWYVHRQFTFGVDAPPSIKELVRYYLSNSIGAAVNYGCYALIVALFSTIPLIIPFSIASIIALAANYLGAKFFVFKHRKR